MKLKYKFVIREIDGRQIAVAVGADGARFRGMVKLNETGKFIFDRLADDTTADGIADALASAYGIPVEEALASVTDFTDRLRDSGLIE